MIRVVVNTITETFIRFSFVDMRHRIAVHYLHAYRYARVCVCVCMSSDTFARIVDSRTCLRARREQERELHGTFVRFIFVNLCYFIFAQTTVCFEKCIFDSRCASENARKDDQMKHKNALQLRSFTSACAAPNDMWYFGGCHEIVLYFSFFFFFSCLWIERRPLSNAKC